MDDHAERFRKLRHEARMVYDARIRNLDQDEKHLDRLVERFVANPLQIIDSTDLTNFRDNYKIDLRKIYEAICEEHKWLYVMIYQENYRRWHMIVPNRSSTQKLVASLLLSATPTGDDDHKTPVIVGVRPRAYTFVFRDETGKAILDEWIQQCHSDPLSQLALGFGQAFKRD